MQNARLFTCRLVLVVVFAGAVMVQRATAQSWTVQSDSGSPVEVDHNPDGTWTVTPQGGDPSTYGADNAGGMVNDFGINAGDFSSMQSQVQTNDDAGDGSTAGNGQNGGGDDDTGNTSGESNGGDDGNASNSDGGDDNSGGMSGDSGGGDSGGGDSGGGESSGGDSGD